MTKLNKVSSDICAVVPKIPPSRKGTSMWGGGFSLINSNRFLI